jgi:hypothetical protein
LGREREILALMKVTRTVVTAVAIGILLSSAAAAKDAIRVPLFVFTHTDPSGFTDADETVRVGTVTAMTQQLAKSKLVRIVATREDATLVLEVTKTGSISEPDVLAALINMNRLGPRDTQLPISDKVLHRYATLTVGEYSTELHGHAFPVGKGLGRAVEGWVTANLDRLMAK